MPLLLLRDSALRHNARAMADWCTSAGVRLAPHGKTTMAPQLFARQLAAGAWGITAATISQAQVYRAFGVDRVLIANELTDRAGIRWLATELTADPEWECYAYVDSIAGVGLLDEALRAAAASRPLPVLVELGFPGGRTGCRSVAEALVVAAAVSQAPTLALAGVAGFEGGLGTDASQSTLDAVARLSVLSYEHYPPAARRTGSVQPDRLRPANCHHRASHRRASRHWASHHRATSPGTSRRVQPGETIFCPNVCPPASLQRTVAAWRNRRKPRRSLGNCRGTPQPSGLPKI